MHDVPCPLPAPVTTRAAADSGGDSACRFLHWAIVSVATQEGGRWRGQLGRASFSGRSRRRDDCGFSMVVVAISMVVVAVLVLLAAKATLGTTGSSNDSVSGNPSSAERERPGPAVAFHRPRSGLGPRRWWWRRQHRRPRRLGRRRRRWRPGRGSSPGCRQPSPRSPSS